MLKMTLDRAQQAALSVALAQMDSFESVTPGVDNGPKVVRAPYKLGAARRVLVKNINALRASQASFDEARQALVKEIWPNKADDENITAETDPVNFPVFIAGFQKMVEAKDDLELLPFPAATIYEAGNEFPAEVLALLESHSLIE